MGHGDPSTNDATKTPPDRGGGSFPSLARMRARWAAFSLAAAVLLGGSRALADDGPRVHIDSPVPAALAEDKERGWRLSPSRRHSWRELDPPVCDSPCDKVIATGVYVIAGPYPKSVPFSLPDVRGDLTITVRPGSYGRRTAGFFCLLFCPLGILVPGPAMLAYSGLLSADRESAAALSGAGIGLMVAGGLAVITGGVLLATSGTKVKLQQPAVGPVGSAAPIRVEF